jgi:hypothetical protein
MTRGGIRTRNISAGERSHTSALDGAATWTGQKFTLLDGISIQILTTFFEPEQMIMMVDL